MTPRSHFKKAGELLWELGISAPDEIDIEAIAQYCGATIVYEELHGCVERFSGKEIEPLLR